MELIRRMVIYQRFFEKFRLMPRTYTREFAKHMTKILKPNPAMSSPSSSIREFLDLWSSSTSLGDRWEDAGLPELARYLLGARGVVVPSQFASIIPEKIWKLIPSNWIVGMQQSNLLLWRCIGGIPHAVCSAKKSFALALACETVKGKCHTVRIWSHAFLIVSKRLSVWFESNKELRFTKIILGFV